MLLAILLVSTCWASSPRSPHWQLRTRQGGRRSLSAGSLVRRARPPCSCSCAKGDPDPLLTQPLLASPYKSCKGSRSGFWKTIRDSWRWPHCPASSSASSSGAAAPYLVVAQMPQPLGVAHNHARPGRRLGAPNAGRRAPATRRTGPLGLSRRCLLHPAVDQASIRAVGLFRLYWDTEKSLTRLAQNYLAPGTRIDHLLLGTRDLIMPRWLLVFTEQSIVVIELDVNPRSGITRPFSNVPRMVLPRRTRIGPIYGHGWITVGGERLFVPMSKRKIAAIDAEAGFPPPTAR